MNRILIVDDIEENLYLMHALLKGYGYTVDQARNGSEALVSSFQQLPDMVISDILMPVIDGFTLCRIWKADERLSRVPFVFYTATYTDQRDEEFAYNLGADAFIIKPAEPAEFVRRVENVLAMSKNGNLKTPQKPKLGEEAILKTYNEVLIRKLEDKMFTLEQTNRELQMEIAGRRRIELALQENEERYRALFENSIDGILLTTRDDEILSANQMACRIFGRSEAELQGLGSNIRNAIIDPGDPRLKSALEERERTGSFSGELTGRRKDGSTFPCEVNSALYKDSKGNTMSSIIVRDITDRKKIEGQIVDMLNEKTVLLQEIHHRVKNNLQIIIAMIGLHAEIYPKGLTAGEFAGFVREMETRIQSIVLVHEMLYQSENLSRINFSEYIKNLIGSLMHWFKIPEGQVTTYIDVTERPLDVVTAVPLGLLINELVSNILKYAFPAGRKGEINVLMTSEDNEQFSLTVRDNGIGLPDGFDFKETTTIGMRMVSILASQLNGSLEISGNDGTVVRLGFRIPAILSE